MSETKPERVVIRCDCGAKLAVPWSDVSRLAECPNCQARFRVDSDGSVDPVDRREAAPLFEPPVESSTRVPEKLKLRCPCGARFAVPSTAAGRKVRCPKCERKLVIPDPPVKRETSPVSDDRNSLLEGLADGDASTAVGGQGFGFAQCPKCGEGMMEDMEGCIHCGHGMPKSRNLPTAKAEKNARKSSAFAGVGAAGGSASMEATWPLIKGTIVSFIMAMAGAVIWIVVALFTGTEWGLLAWGIGGLAGLGMLIGCRGQNSLSGPVAAGMGGLSIMAGKVGIYLLFVAMTFGLGELERFTNVIELSINDADVQAMRDGLSYDDPKREALVTRAQKKYEQMSDEELDIVMAEYKQWRETGRWTEDLYVRDYLVYATIDDAMEAWDGIDYSDDQWDAWYTAAFEEVDVLPAEDRLTQAKAAALERDVDFNEFDELTEIDDEMYMDEGEDTFFAMMFAPWDFVFFGLAMFTAYRVGGGG